MLRAARIALSALLLVTVVLGGCTSDVEVSRPLEPPGAGESRPVMVEVELADYAIRPSELTIDPEFVLDIRNVGPTPHNLTIRTESGAVGEGTPEIEAGARVTLDGRLDPGRYLAFCSLPGHENLGMLAVLVVRG